MMFHSSHIEGQSTACQQPADMRLGHYDLVIVGASWDTRCAWISEVRNLSADLGVILTYERSDREGRQESNRTAIQAFMKDKCRRLEVVKGSSNEIELMWSRIMEVVDSLKDSLTRPMRICLDITAIPRFCSLAALAGFLKSGAASHMTFLYAEGEYEEGGQKAKYVFHEGAWSSLPIKYLEVPYDPLKRKFILVSVGFEGDRTIRVTQEEEPDRVSILFSSPGVKKGYVRRAMEENRELISSYKIPHNQKARAAAGDAISAWSCLHSAGLERPDEENTFYLSCGTKPHALALGLRALTSGLGTVLYYVPDEHKPTDVKAAGTYWRYEIRDLSAFPACGGCRAQAE